MKRKCNVLPVLALLGLVLWAGTTAKAQITNLFTVSLTVQYQNEGVDNAAGTVTTYPSPGSQKVATKDLLSLLAEDEYVQGYYPNTNFPAGAKLAYVDGQFLVLDKTNNVLCDVSDILYLEGDTDQVLSGKLSDLLSDDAGDPFPASTYTTLNYVYFSFDDTFIIGGYNLSFYVGGVDKSVTSATAPNLTTGVYTESKTHTISTSSGSGYADGNYFVVTGSITASGKATFIMD